MLGTDWSSLKCVCVCMHMRVHVCMCVPTCVHPCAHVRVCMRVHVHAYVCMCACVHTCACVHACAAYVRARVCVRGGEELGQGLRPVQLCSILCSRGQDGKRKGSRRGRSHEDGPSGSGEEGGERNEPEA